MQERTSGAASLAGLRRKLFIIAAYLAVSAALLCLVSYGQYKVSIEGTVNMTRAASIQASIALQYDLDDMDDRSAGTNTVDLASFLTNLRPGDNAEEYANEYMTNGNKTGHWMCFSVYNYNRFTNDDISSLPLAYHVRIKTNYRLPLDIYLVTSDDAKDYHMTYVSGNREYRILTEAGEEQSFTLGNATKQSQEFYAFVGWETLDLNNMAYARQKASSELRKEVEVLELYVVLNSDQEDDGLAFINRLSTEAEIKEKLDAHIESVIDASAPESEEP